MATFGGTPLVSIVIPVKDGANRIGACLESLRRLDYPPERLEIIIADGRSRDHTRAIAAAYGARVVDNPGELVASGRNVGFAAARGEVIAFTDDDCTFDEGWLREAIPFLSEPLVAGVGGPTLVPPDETPFGRAVAFFFRLGVRLAGSVHAEKVGAIREVTDLPGCNMIYKRDALSRVLPGPEHLTTCEDVELGYSLRELGFRLRIAPTVKVWHHKRPTPRGFFRQIARFAQGRVQLARQRRGVLRPAHVLAGLALPAAALALPLTLVSAPILVALVGGVALVSTRDAGVAARAAVLVPAAVSAWSYGFLREVLFPSAPPTLPKTRI